jgi:hypothetical protein
MGTFSATRLISRLLVLLVPASLFAQQIPLVNWTVPPYRSAGASGGLRTMADISPGVGFVAMQPCRIVDTRGGGVFTGAYGPPALVANATRSFDIDSAPHCTGIPSGVEAYSLNFTVVNTTGGPGDLRAWPTGNPPVQTTSVLNWTSANVIIANATIIGAGTNGSIDVTAAGFGTHVLIDINGYFPSVYNPGNQFVAAATIGGEAAILGGNFSAIAGSHGVGGFAGGAGVVHGVQGQVSPSALAGSSGVHGINDSAASGGFGVLGEVTSGAAGIFSAGVRGTHNGTGSAGIGVIGEHNASGIGVLGLVPGSGTGATGVAGIANAEGGDTFGVKGVTNSDHFGAAGVKGVSGLGDPLGDNLDCLYCFTAGVRGVDGGTGNESHGVLGISRGTGTTGVLLNTTGEGSIAVGYLGKRFGDDPDVISDPVWGVFASANIGATGNKYFVEPHPTDPSLVIRYISLEGPEAGTYFRGRGRFQNGIAEIDVPEDFRLVTDAEGLSVQVTPIGEMATVAVVRIGLDRIVVRGSRDVGFFYTVNGVRRSFKGMQPIAKGSEFRPSKATATIPAYLSEGQKRSLIANGTYKADGSVNRETAKRLGWDTRWKVDPQPRTSAGGEIQ